MKTRHPHQGFTLIELLIVIAIVAILVPTFMPARVDYTPRAKVTENPVIVTGPKVFVSASCESVPHQSFSTIADVPPNACFLHPADKTISVTGATSKSITHGVP